MRWWRTNGRDLSDPDFGVALLNDSKYGYATHGNVMRLSLLRAPTSPRPGSRPGPPYLPLRAAAARRRAADRRRDRRRLPLQRPTAVCPHQRQTSDQRSFFRVSNPAVVLDTVKKAEDSDEIVVRLYEAHGTQTNAALATELPVLSAHRCNLLEDEEGPEIRLVNGSLAFSIKPFEIVSFKLKLSK